MNCLTEKYKFNKEMASLQKVGILSLAVIIVEALLILFVNPFLGITSLFTLNSSLLSILSLAIGSFVVVYLGFFIYEQNYVRLWRGTNLTQRLGAILLYGAVVLTLGLYLTKQLNYIGGFVLDIIILAVVIALSSRYLNFPRV